MGKLLRRFFRRIHPEGIPWPGSAFYAWLSTSRPYQRHYERVAEDIASHCAEGSLLDVGTGPGWLLPALRRVAPGLRLVGIDLSPAMVAKARRNMARVGLADRIELHEANGSQMPFPDASFDIVASTGSVHHWRQLTAVFAEIHRVAKPGAWVLLYDLVSDTPPAVTAAFARESGKLWALLFRLLSVEEPFYSREALEALAQPTPFVAGPSHFVGLLCCLPLRKDAP